MCIYEYVHSSIMILLLEAYISACKVNLTCYLILQSIQINSVVIVWITITKKLPTWTKD